MATVAEPVAAAEARPMVPTGEGERFAGYGVMGLPFRTGHVLAMRRMPASSIGPAYTSVWHRDPDGRWALWQDQPAELGCPRYFSNAVAEMRRVAIDLAWTGPSAMRLVIDDVGLQWTATIGSSPMTSVLNTVGRLLPDRAWHTRPVLSMLSRIAATALRTGRLRLTGTAPNGQRFVANPLRVWLITSSSASIGDRDLGTPGPLPVPATLGEFMIPQRGVFAIGRAYFAAPTA